jgi:hypothetical protein
MENELGFSKGLFIGISLSIPSPCVRIVVMELY